MRLTESLQAFGFATCDVRGDPPHGLPALSGRLARGTSGQRDDVLTVVNDVYSPACATAASRSRAGPRQREACR